MDSAAPDRGALFAQRLVQYDRELLAYIMTLIPRRDDAEEVLQRTAIVLWEKFEDYDDSRGFAPWAMRHAYFEILNFRKEMARSRLVFREDLMAMLVEVRQTHEPTLQAQRDALQACMSELDATSRQLLYQRYTDSGQLQGESQSMVELARAAGKSAKSVYRKLYRLRVRIGRCVERRLVSDSHFA